MLAPVDEDLREARRRWERAPEDVAAADAYAAALRRAGRPPPWALREQRRHPARRLSVDAPVDVTAEVDLGREVGLGFAPRDGSGLDVPACRAWWFQPEGMRASDLVALARAHGAPHLELIHAPARRFDLDGLAVRSLAAKGPLSRSTWARLARLPALEQLEVRSTPPGTRLVLPPTLSALALERLDADGLPALADGPPLSALVVANPDPGLGLPALRALGALEHLEALGLAWRARPDDELAALARWSELRWLKLAGPPDTSNAVAATIAGLERLEHLALSQLASLTDDGVALLARLRLRTLRLEAARLTDLAFDALSRCPTLTSLALDARSWPPDASRLTDAGLARLTAPALRDLSLSAPRLTGEGLAASGLPELRRLRLDLRDEAAASAVARLPRLEQLDAGHVALTEPMLDRLAQAPRLRALRAAVSVPAFAALGRLVAAGRVDELDLTVDALAPELIAALARGAGVRRLHLRRPWRGPGARADVAPLAALERLEDLAILGASVDPATWAPLARLERLRVVRHESPALAAVSAALPRAHAVVRLPTVTHRLLRL